MKRRKLMRWFWTGIAALFITAALKGIPARPGHCATSAACGHSTPHHVPAHHPRKAK